MFTSKENKQELVWATSWGVSTRLVGALIMTHSDDHGLVLPPKLAPVQVAIVPIAKNGEQLDAIGEYIKPVIAALRAKGITVKFDNDDTKKPGWKFAEYEFKGYPVRIAVGPRDMENGTVEVARRDTLEKQVMQVADLADKVEHLLQAIQDNLFQKALAMRENMTRAVDSYDEFKVEIEKGGFLLAHWDGTAETEEKVKNETKATIRCIPLEGDRTPGACMVTGQPSTQRVIFARAY
jgi:prolyl-tRNA synthetase